ncbi:deformed epidermal autoregulatory factor 1 homolog isoform X2 [Cephus cinctus]|uniref:Deformed epidermal autoregulatory factor 1 homolog isoform X2 n=1 Tax=Cephus cinctus TaxID=211228 RepID=A0AAJ7RSK4_CEPCN|nr:deformed epidermal autoregulatory factor 1 homolog isoform X2 [Cephus cinctus]
MLKPSTNVPGTAVSCSLSLPGSGQSNQILSADKDTDAVPCHGELIPPKILIESSEDEGQSDQTNVSAANMAVLPVRCNTTNAELHKRRFGSGGRGRSIKVGQNWYTPIEFKALCGRASTNDWTKSIRFGGRNLEKLIDEEILKPHATSCFCAICCDDDSATSPVRLHTPRRRRKRQVSGRESPFYKYESDNSRNESDNEVVLDKEVCPQLFSTDGLLLQQPQHQYNVQNVHQTEDRQNDDDDIFRNIDEVSKKLSDLVLEFGINQKKQELKRQLRRGYNKVKEDRE